MTGNTPTLRSPRVRVVVPVEHFSKLLLFFLSGMILEDAKQNVGKIKKTSTMSTWRAAGPRVLVRLSSRGRNAGGLSPPWPGLLARKGLGSTPGPVQPEPEGKPPRSKRVGLGTELAGFRAQIPAAAQTGSVATPLFQTSTFDVSDQSVYDYTRSGNPTRQALEELCSTIEHGEAAFAFSSGMAALNAVLRLLQPGDGVLASRDIYGGMHRLLRHSAVHSGLDVHFAETWDLHAVEQLLDSQPNIRMLCVESPSNPLMRVSDLRALAALAHRRGALLCVDNSVMSPVLSQPLRLGADIVV